MSVELLNTIAAELDESYVDRVGVNRGEIPRREEIRALIDEMFELVLPGFGETGLTLTETAPRLERLHTHLCVLGEQIYYFFCEFRKPLPECDAKTRSAAAAEALLRALPGIRAMVKQDIAAAYAGDPAATSQEEIVLAYPCMRAITIQRMAHVLYESKLPLIPRLMTEYAHTLTGIDIHPGAHLGSGVFIDHGTGVVIGETATIGDNVRIYQGVTLGALSFPKDACGMLIKGQKRHPTVEANVTIYAGATVLGDITIGQNSVIGGNVWLTESLPPNSKITARPPEQQVRTSPK